MSWNYRIIKHDTVEDILVAAEAHTLEADLYKIDDETVDSDEWREQALGFMRNCGLVVRITARQSESSAYGTHSAFWDAYNQFYKK